MRNDYLTPTLEILRLMDDILTSSPEAPDVDKDGDELPWIDWQGSSAPRTRSEIRLPGE